MQMKIAALDHRKENLEAWYRKRKAQWQCASAPGDQQYALLESLEHELRAELQDARIIGGSESSEV